MLWTWLLCMDLVLIFSADVCTLLAKDMINDCHSSINMYLLFEVGGKYSHLIDKEVVNDHLRAYDIVCEIIFLNC